MELNPLGQLNAAVIVGVTIILIATYLLLRRVFVLPYVEVMQAREELLRAADSRLADAGSLVTAAESEAAEVAGGAALEAERFIDEAREHTEGYRNRVIADATAVAAERIDAGRAEIEATRASELERVKAQAIECVDIACGRLLGSADPRTVEAAVDRAMARRVQ